MVRETSDVISAQGAHWVMKVALRIHDITAQIKWRSLMVFEFLCKYLLRVSMPLRCVVTGIQGVITGANKSLRLFRLLRKQRITVEYELGDYYNCGVKNVPGYLSVFRKSYGRPKME